MSNYYLGLDVSKGYADFALLDEAKQLVERTFQLDDTFEGHHALLQYLQTFASQHLEASLFAAVESTGGYENNWYERLKDVGQILPLRVARLNPAAVKANAEAGMRRNRTDALSAREVAEYLIAHPEKVRYNEISYPILRRSWKFIRLLSKQKTQLLNQLDSLLYITMPEILSFCHHGYPRWLLQLLKAYPTYQQLRAAGVVGLRALPYVSHRKAERIIQLVQHGIGKSDPLSGQMITFLAEQILQLDGQITLQSFAAFVERFFQRLEPIVDGMRIAWNRRRRRVNHGFRALAPFQYGRGESPFDRRIELTGDDVVDFDFGLFTGVDDARFKKTGIGQQNDLVEIRLQALHVFFEHLRRARRSRLFARAKNHIQQLASVMNVQEQRMEAENIFIALPALLFAIAVDFVVARIHADDELAFELFG